jgi:hypothetical protein
MEPDQDDLCRFVVQPRVVLPLRAGRYNILPKIGLQAQIVVMLSRTTRAKDTIKEQTKDTSGVEEMKEMVKSDAEGMMVKGGAEGVLAKKEVQAEVEPSVLEMVD